MSKPLNPTVAIIIPVQNEAECLGSVLDELKAALGERFGDEICVAVGLNACTDSSRDIAGKHGVFIGETEKSGYGHGCVAAIRAVPTEVSAFVFYAGDGANRPEDLLRLIDEFEACGGEKKFIIGVRKFQLRTWFEEFGRALPNLILGLSCAALGGQFFSDLGPLRLIEKTLFEKIDPQEFEWGWTIEAQLVAARLGEKIDRIEVVERPRFGGQQKVSGVSMWRSAKIGWRILRAAIRVRFRKI